jgi:BirA family biotin operon repressor/biotin-[acetyl-CoA-carboxylase] ligase
MIVHWHDTLPSTQDEALRRLSLGEADFVVAARAQTAGRGRRGGVWTAPPGDALLATLGLRLPPARPASDLTLVLALSLADCLEPLLPPEVRPALRVKWPNDLWIGGAKVAGILGEARTQGERVNVALGFGVNLRQEAAAFGPELAGSATSLALSGCVNPPDPEQFLAELLPRFRARRAEWEETGLAVTLAGLQPRWAFSPGEMIQVEWREGLQAARYLGMSEAGSLRAQLDGSPEVVELIAGEVRRIRPA